MQQTEIIFKHYPELDSTMNEAKRLILSENSDYKSASLICISTDFQSQGRGQHGKSWSSPRNAGLYLSLISDILIPAEKPSIKATETCLKGLEQCIEQIAPGEHKGVLRLKPLNDIYFDNNKLAGILIERFFHNETEYNTIGIGINLYRSTYQLKESSPEAAKASPISMEEIIGLDYTKELEKKFLNILCKSFLENFYQRAEY